MIEQLVATILGGLFRLAPELLKLFNRWLDDKHELEMLKQSGAIEANKYKYKVQLASVEKGNSDYNNSLYESIIKLQTKKTGVKYIDAINSLVRPYVTYILMGLYVFIKLYFIFNGVPLNLIWTEVDMSLLSGILSFWFVGRVLDKK